MRLLVESFSKIVASNWECEGGDAQLAKTRIRVFFFKVREKTRRDEVDARDRRPTRMRPTVGGGERSALPVGGTVVENFLRFFLEQRFQPAHRGDIIGKTSSSISVPQPSSPIPSVVAKAMHLIRAPCP